MLRFALMGKPFRLVYRTLTKCHGDCQKPEAGAPGMIRIARGLEEERELDVIIHECLHGCGWHIDEEFVDQAATDIARVLTLAGWRKAE